MAPRRKNARSSAENQAAAPPTDLPHEIPIDEWSRPCSPEQFSFETTNDLPDLADVIGQPRAFRALELATEVGGIGYNIFVLGVPDSGRTTLTREYLLRKAANSPTPDDWCYVHNFDDPHQPRALRLPAGRGVELRREMATMTAGCKTNIQRAFASEEYAHERDRLLNAAKETQALELNQLEETLRRYNFILLKTPYGLAIGPGIQGKPLTQEEFDKLSDEQKEKLRQLQEMLSANLEKTLARLREIERAAQEGLNDLDLRTSMYIISPLLDDLRARFAGIEPVLAYFEQVEKDLALNAGRFRPGEKSDLNPLEQKEWASRYEVNVIVNHSDRSGAPVIVENQPTYHNLLGSIEHDMVLGASYTDFTKIRAGALHRANGGYLILPARAELVNPYAWEGLKRVLRDGEIRMLELGSQMGLASAASLEPEPIPLSIKVIMVGTPMLYYLLRANDEDFAKLFKVRADFATEMERNSQSEQEYARFIKSVIDDNHLLPFDRSAVARIVEHGARMVGHQQKLSTQFGIIADLVCEADYWAKKSGQGMVDAAAVQKSLEERIFRSNLVEERIQQVISDNTVMVDVSGFAVGQINGLSVSGVGDYSFGRPNRLTASVYAGRAGVIDIEREARLGGPIHTKGVLIIGGFLGARFGQDRPLNLSASLTFEQSYDEIEGDSASAAELLVLLSALSGVPIDQGRAITGSINQHGQIQAIGGVNEKIEGFFETCKRKGLTGSQGVILPQANRRNLMLSAEVRAAAAAGQFHLWAVSTIDEAALLLTGQPLGQRQPDGSYPEGSICRAAAERLESFGRALEPKPQDKKQRSSRRKEEG